MSAYKMHVDMNDSAPGVLSKVFLAGTSNRMYTEVILLYLLIYAIGSMA